MTPHKHARFIKAWADGHEIEYWDNILDEWYGVYHPSWALHLDYRIKPKQLTYRLALFEDDSGKQFLILETQETMKMSEIKGFVKYLTEQLEITV